MCVTSTVFHCSLLYQAPLTSADTLTLAGSVNIKNGNGSGSVSVSGRRVMSHRAWGSVSVSLHSVQLHCKYRGSIAF